MVNKSNNYFEKSNSQHTHHLFTLIIHYAFRFIKERSVVVILFKLLNLQDIMINYGKPLARIFHFYLFHSRRNFPTW